MCAIFGFISRGISRPDLSILRRIVCHNACRGPDAFGFAWIDSFGRMHSYKQCGRLSDKLGVLAMAKDARLLIGHLRWATHGAPAVNINNHPHPADGGWLVHNGVIHNYEDLLISEDLHPVSDCDSESIGLLMERSQSASTTQRAIEAVSQTDGGLAMLGLWKPGSLLALRRGNPLHLSDTPEGTYLATLSSGLPGKVTSVKDNSAVLFTRRRGHRMVTTHSFSAHDLEIK